MKGPSGPSKGTVSLFDGLQIPKGFYAKYVVTIEPMHSTRIGASRANI